MSSLSSLGEGYYVVIDVQAPCFRVIKWDKNSKRFEPVSTFGGWGINLGQFWEPHIPVFLENGY